MKSLVMPELIATLPYINTEYAVNIDASLFLIRMLDIQYDFASHSVIVLVYKLLH